MGMIICEKHGLSGFCTVCIHLFEGLETTWVAFPEFPGTTLTKVCAHCAEKSNLSELNHLKGMTFDDQLNMSEDAFEKQLEIIGEKHRQITTKSICILCYDELQVMHHRKSSLPDPFPVYENTLVYQDRNQVKQLEDYLKTHFTFPKFRYSIFHQGQPDKSAIQVSRGNIRKPLSIDVYYITEHGQQQQLIQLVDTFFERIAKKQRLIRFYEKEDVICKTLPNGGHSQERREGNVLREVEIK
ncbi:hypothetical protein BKI52_08390 [marine bacterium AO1-C]|nr:hypothetical protein BKI52_08390 [marine bacterium AO1-C]